MAMATKRLNIQHASVLNSNENQPWHRKLGLICKKTIYIKSFFPSPPRLGQCNSTLDLSFSSFLALEVDHETDTDVSFPIPINDAECKARLFVLEVN